MDRPPIQENRLYISLFVPFRAVFGKTISLWFVKTFVKVPESLQKYAAPTWREVWHRHWPLPVAFLSVAALPGVTI
jgi:hypothetical protein